MIGSKPHPDYGFDVISEAYQKPRTHPIPVGPSTYLHAGAAKGWPADQKAEDTFELPPVPPRGTVEPREYRAEFGTDGSARLVLDKTTTIATFDTFADAQLAAEALNNHKGY